MTNYTKVPIKIEYEKLNVKISFDIHIIDLDKHIKDGNVYLQIMSDDCTKPVVKEKAEIKIDKMNAKITLNIPLEISHKFLRGEKGDYIYIKHVNKLTTEDLK